VWLGSISTVITYMYSYIVARYDYVGLDLFLDMYCQHIYRYLVVGLHFVGTYGLDIFLDTFIIYLCIEARDDLVWLGYISRWWPY